MNEQDKERVIKDYQEKKQKGVPFFPDVLFKDALIGLLVLVVLISLSAFLGTPLEERADPGDTGYLPRPEWYFRFLFQLLKYFPGELEVLGVVVIPGLAVLLLFALPFLDRGPKRHFSHRLPIMIVMAFLSLTIIGLTAASYLEAPPPVEEEPVDPIAALYTSNCAGCHGPSSNIPTDGDMFEIISQGSHEGMPAWSGDLTSQEIESLIGFITSSTGSQVFAENCSDCHDATSMMFSDPELLRSVLDFSAREEEHTGSDVTFANQPLSLSERTSLVNFLIAPEGERLFVNYCTACHGSGVSAEGDFEVYREIIRRGGLHREMPAWDQILYSDEIEAIAQYLDQPSASTRGGELYQEHCTSCHFNELPSVASVEEAIQTIRSGGTHESMPYWGNILGEEQIDALAQFALNSALGNSMNRGETLYIDNCASCHGEFGEGGVNPARRGDIIAPIGTADYLATRDDFTLTQIIERGQPNFGMAPFGLGFGGPLDDDDVDAVVDYLRSWESDPPVEVPPEIEIGNVYLPAAQIYQSVCAQCHGENATGGFGPSLRSSSFLDRHTPEDVFNTISEGHEATSMIAWGELLTSSQIQDLVDFILSFPPTDENTSDEVSFAISVLPAFDQYCSSCHDNSLSEGGWNASTYSSVMESGENAPVIVPGNLDESLLAQMILGNEGPDLRMPPAEIMPEDVIDFILKWIEQGAMNN